jgi:hypothetical protein
MVPIGGCRLVGIGDLGVFVEIQEIAEGVVVFALALRGLWLLEPEPVVEGEPVSATRAAIAIPYSCATTMAPR